MKMKSRKSIAKRFSLTGKKANRWGKKAKLIRRSAGQNHFNARDAGKTTLKKRRSHVVFLADHKNLERLASNI